MTISIFTCIGISFIIMAGIAGLVGLYRILVKRYGIWAELLGRTLVGIIWIGSLVYIAYYNFYIAPIC